MNEQRKCLVGYDDAEAEMFFNVLKAVIGLSIVLIVIAIGVFVGGWYSLKHYFIALKENVYDNN